MLGLGMQSLGLRVGGRVCLGSRLVAALRRLA